MIPRADSDHPIDKIRFGLMVAIGGEDATETLEEIQRQEHVARRELEEVPQRAAARGEEFLKGSEEVRTELLSQLAAQGFAELGRVLRQRDEAASLNAKLRGGVRTYFAFARRNPALY